MRFWRNRGGGSPKVYQKCQWCEREIWYGESLVTVNMSVEQVKEQDGDTFIEVEQSDTLLLVCESCGEGLEPGSLGRALGSQRPA